MVPPPCSYAQGGFSEGKSLLFHPKSASKPLQGQVLAQQNVLVAQWGTASMEWGRGRQMVVELLGVGSQAAAAPRSRARSHGERAPTKIQAGPCSPPQSCLHLVPPSATPSSQLLPPPWLSLLTPQNVPTESKTPRRTPQHSNPPPHTSPASSPAPALPPSHHMQAAAMAGPLLSAEPETWRAWGGASFEGDGADMLAKNMSHVLGF